jgi:hypothetical protein
LEKRTIRRSVIPFKYQVTSFAVLHYELIFLHELLWISPLTATQRLNKIFWTQRVMYEMWVPASGEMIPVKITNINCIGNMRISLTIVVLDTSSPG